MGEVAAVGQVEAHDAVVGLEERRVDGEVGGGAREGLDVYAPLGRVEAEGLQGALLAELLHLGCRRKGGREDSGKCVVVLPRAGGFEGATGARR